MKLLKYPLSEHIRKVNALTAIGPYLLLADSDSHVHVWSQQRLVDAAFDGSKIKDLSMEYSFPVDFDTNAGDKNIVFMIGDKRSLFIGTEHKIIRYRSWLKTSKEADGEGSRTIFQCTAPCNITDLKYDERSKVLFVMSNSPNRIVLFNAESLDQLAHIPLQDTITPITGVIDPMGQTFTVLASDRSILIYQYNEKGSFKLINKLAQYVNINPLHYKITMPPQANILPVINSVKGNSSTSSTSILLLDRNDNYKIVSTLVSPPSNQCKVLKYSPKVYEKTNLKKGTKNRYNLLSTSGSKDGTVVVWNTKRVKPLFSAIQVSETPINDIVWSEDGLKLFVMSDDNVLYNFAFQENDLGQTLSSREVSILQDENKKLNPLPDVKPSHGEPIVKTELDKLPSILDGETPRSSSKKHNKKKIAPQIVKTSQSSSMEYNGPSYAVPKDLKRKPKVEVNKELNGVKRPKKELEPMDFLETGLTLPIVAFSKIRLATPRIRLLFDYSPPNNDNLVFEVKNGLGNEQKPTIVALVSRLEEQERTLFQDLIPKFITMCTAGNMFWACCSNDGTIYIYSDSGKKVLPPLCLGIPCSFLEACANYLLCVTSVGQLYCWDMDQKKLHFPVNSIYPLLSPSLRYSDDVLTRAENITICAVTKRGIPLVTLSNGDGYMFDKDMEAWLLISDGWWAYGSQYWDMTNTTNLNNTGAVSSEVKRNKFWNSNDAQQLAASIREDNRSIINFMERKTNDELTRKGRIRNLQRFARTILMKEGYENMEEIVTLSHLENRLLVTLKLGEDEEFSNILLVYCIRLSELGYTERLNDVLQWLYNDGDYDASKLAGKSRKELLKEVLIACANIRHVQRITTGYASALGMVNDSL